MISSEGIKVDSEKVSALDAWPLPKSVKEVRQLIGFMSYYRRFVPKFAQNIACVDGQQRQKENLGTVHVELRMPDCI